MATGNSSHRVEALPGTQHVRVEIDGQVVADSTRPVLLYETGYPVRYYLPPEDVRLEHFEPTETHTHCPFKGDASYWSYHGDGRERSDVLWSYPAPPPDLAQITNLMAFYDEAVDIVVEGPGPAT
ncbi:DUF427 domain-containing protein [Streptomyces sp. TP-A0874]|uniref:DUF427 domain-containing protein n=1 Tax=Streptomyces sp. TP-A0874 TaxID=549819 RepID=UPI000852CE3D|nr:DUF427 domain-containing protein [Streptomyces sp. TP-A0874]